jgi:hypothetical protein
MKFQVGDKVVVRLSNEEGEVIEIIDEKMVIVEVRGVKFPAYTDQLDFPYFKWFTEKKLVQDKKKIEKQYIDHIPRENKKIIRKEADGVWLTFIPVFVEDEFGDDVVDRLKIHLINKTNDHFKFTYQLDYFGETHFELNNEVIAFEDFYIHDIDFENLNDSPAFNFEFSLKESSKQKAAHHEAHLKLKPKQVFKQIEQLQKKGEPTFSYKLFDEYPDKPFEEDKGLDMSSLMNKGFKVKVYDASKGRQYLEPARQNIDLHIENLTPDPDVLDNFEKMTLQLDTFEKYLELAIAHHLPMFIAIHGVGTGKLRDEIHEVLRTKKEVKHFVNRYHPAYGFGATEIFFQY